MAIEFRCTNGHRLSCPDARVGRPGKCPTCGAAFRVPSASTPSASDSAIRPELQEPNPEGSKTGLGSGTISLAAFAEKGDPNAEEQIVFLCPNGHKLTCASRLQGRPGKCPHCGAKFLIPDYEISDDSDQEAQASASEAGAYAEVGDGSDIPFDFSSLINNATPQAAEGALHSMARLFFQLWKQKGRSGTIELYLRGGERLAPDRYAPGLSRESYGLFAVRDGDGRYTLSAVNWDAIERVAVRGVKGLPKGVFEVE
jgi:hypothetical protein